jgi:inorganic pyrophosphatase
MEIEVVIEIPKGTRNKYEADDQGRIWLDRMLFTSTRYPEDYGYVPETLAEDGDPVDAMVILDEATFPGCHLRARPVGVFRMRDEEGVDAKLLCVLASDHRWDHVNDLPDLPGHQLTEIAHFFEIYKDLEPGKSTEPGGWAGRAGAEEEIVRGRERFAARQAGA